MANLKLRQRRFWRRRYTTLLPTPGLRPLRRKPDGCIIRLPFCCPTAACLRPDPIRTGETTNCAWKSIIRHICSAGPRPFIETVPQQILYGGEFEIHTPQAEEIQWVELIWPMATTHSCETGQRVVDLEFKAHDFCHLHVNVLSEQNIAPPGWYMLFLVNKLGVPSVARWVQLTGGAKPDHEPAEIKQHLDMHVTSKDNPVPGTKRPND